MIICKPHNFIFYDIPKTATVSIIHFIKNAGIEIDIKRHNFDPNCECYKEFFKWTIIRNPYDKILSAWRTTQFRNVRKEIPLGFKPRMQPLNKWLRQLPNILETTQYSLLSKATKGHLEDLHLIRFENLIEELFTLPFMHYFGGKEEFPHMNKSDKSKNWIKYLDKETEQLIWNKYQEDFEVFGYERYDYL